MSLRNRERRIRNATEGKPVRLTLRDVTASVNPEPEDLDYICTREVWYGGEEDEGAPVAIYEDPTLLRRWLSTHHPAHVCDGAECRKDHPNTKPGLLCDGRSAHFKAKNRVIQTAMQTLQAEHPRTYVTAAELSDYLKGEGQ